MKNLTKRPEPKGVRKQRAGRRTKETPTHRCWVCDHWAEIETGSGWWVESQRKMPFYGCAYKQRMARKAQ